MRKFLAASEIGRTVVLATCGLAVSALALTPGAAFAQMTDRQIGDAVENELMLDPATPSNEIDVGVAEGVVSLTGDVNNILAKERATRIASTVKGVRSVSNRIDVEPYWGRMDWKIESDAEEALLYDAATDSYEVNVEVDNNVATLTGTVDSWQEKRLAGKVVKGVRGVTAVNNEIDIEYKTSRPDSEIEAEVEKRLRWDTLVDDGLIDVEVDDGKVRLGGTVGSASEKSRASVDAWVAGVRSVEDSALDVERWARDEDLRKDKYVVKSDKAVEDAIEDALLYDPRVFSFKVAADVSGGVATLRGEVDDLRAKRAAAQVARNTVGVVSVINRVKVRPMTPGDETLETRVSDALLRDPYVERYEVSVNVIDGTAYLSGTVDTYFEKAQADDVASRVYGVTDVMNNLDVDLLGPLAYDPYIYDYYPYSYPWYDYSPTVTYLTDAQIRDGIQSEMFWSPFVDSDEVTVTVDDGEAHLAGEVDTWGEYHSATENAFEGGAVWVDNDLTVSATQ